MEVIVKLTDKEREDLLDRAPHACRGWARMRPYGKGYSVSRFDHDGTILLSLEMLEVGVARCLARCHTVSKQIAPHGQIAALDLPAVDAIVQYAMFGRVIY